MKILILCPFTSGICGVWARAKADAISYAQKGDEVRIFSSNAVKGSDETAPAEEITEGIHIQRYPYRKLGGESFMKWDDKWKQDAIAFAPDLIIAHCYRHPHTTEALEVKEKIGCPVYLIGHAPFIEDNRTRSFLASMAVNFYDKVIGPRTLKKFDKIIAISKWELPYWKKLGVDEGKIEVQINPIQKEFYEQPLGKCRKDIFFLGRISPIKDIETLIRAANLLPQFQFDLVGPIEKEYGERLGKLIENLGARNINFLEPVYDVVKKIEIIDSHKIFVLPSIREAMPTSLLEAVARKRICIASDNFGSREVLEGKPNCHLFKIGNFNKLAELIKEAMKS